MQSPLTFLLAVYALFATALGASLRIRISPTALLPNPANLPPSTHAVLTSEHGSTTTAKLRKDNTILFPDITTTGTHLLQIYTRDYTFANYRIDTTPDPTSPHTTLITLAAETFLGTQWSDTGISLLPRSATSAPAVPELTFAPKILSQKQFYEPRPTFNVLNLLKNPMILMGGVALIFTFGMPKLMENMDPEMKAEYEEMQKKSPVAGVARAMQGGQGPAEGFDLAGYLAGKGGGTAKGADSIR